jgi:anti-sigma-K factor RskA
MNSRATRHWREVVAVTAIVAASAVCAPDATAQKNQGSPNGAPYDQLY